MESFRTFSPASQKTALPSVNRCAKGHPRGTGRLRAAGAAARPGAGHRGPRDSPCSPALAAGAPAPLTLSQNADGKKRRGSRCGKVSCAHFAGTERSPPQVQIAALRSLTAPPADPGAPGGVTRSAHRAPARPPARHRHAAAGEARSGPPPRGRVVTGGTPGPGAAAGGRPRPQDPRSPAARYLAGGPQAQPPARPPPSLPPSRSGAPRPRLSRASAGGGRERPGPGPPGPPAPAPPLTWRRPSPPAALPAAAGRRRRVGTGEAAEALLAPAPPPPPALRPLFIKLFCLVVRPVTRPRAGAPRLAGAPR